MGRRSVRENKTVYQTSRETAGLTREGAEEALVFVSSDRIERIESGRSAPHPDEVLAMAKGYKNPALCNYFCSHECPIGQKTVPEVESKELPQITMEMLTAVHALDRQQERMMEIAADGEISSGELEDFRAIRAELDRMAAAIDSLKLWIDQTVANGTLDMDE